MVVGPRDKNVTQRMPRQAPDHRVVSFVNTAELFLIAYTQRHTAQQQITTVVYYRT